MISPHLPILTRRLACSLAALIFATASAADDSLRGCVAPVHPTPLALLSGSDPVGAVQDVGNLTVMEISGDYDRGLTTPRQEVAAHFFAAHPDQYDFLIVFTTFEFPTGDVTAFYNGIRNDTAGIGQPMFDNGTDFGSASRLQGYIDMAAMGRNSFVPDSPGYQQTLDTLAHELMHRWAANVHFIDVHGNDSADLLGQDNVHWSYFLDTDASVMYGNDWQPQADGTFRSIDVRHRYGPLDLYLAGFAAPTEVAPFTLIRNGSGGAATDLPTLGATSTGQAESISIDQVIAASGARIPNVANAQKDFTGAMILLRRPGENVSSDQLLELERLRVRFEQQFIQMTDGRGIVHLYTQAGDSTSVGLPEILHGSGATAIPPGVGAAVAWLESRQAGDGHWQDRPASAMRDTVATVRVLAELDAGFAGLATARAWIAAHAVANQDQRAWKLIGANLAADAAALSAAQDASGGFALMPGWSTSPFDTALVATALAGNDPGAPSLSTALQLIGTQQNSDGSYGVTTGGRGGVPSTVRAAALFANNSGDGSMALRQHAADWIATQQRDDGGIGTAGQSSLADTAEVYSLAGRLPLAADVVTGTRSYMRQAQQGTGDWGGSVYLTATAALAYAHDQRGNLALAQVPTAAPAQPHDGEQVTLSAVVANTGNVPVAATIARWYDGNPDQDGVQIGADLAVLPLAAGASTPITQVWDSSGRAGDHMLWLLLDADAVVEESSEQDNRASIAVTVAAPSNLPDLTISAADFVLTPSAISVLPSHVHLSGTARNIGVQNVSGAVFRLYAAPDFAHALAETTLDVLGRGSVPLALDFDVTAAATLHLLLRADPDNAIAEGNESNNDASFTLPFGQSIDLEVLPGDLAQVETNALVGRDVDFDVTLHNRGTIDSPPATFHAGVMQNGASTAILDATVQILAGQSVQRRVTWRADQPGAAQLQVVLDAANQIIETREDNNTAQLDFTVAAPDQADLTLVSDSLAFAPAPALQGQPLTATLGVRNLSSAATGSFRVALYAADPHSGAAAIGSTMMAGLGGSSAATASLLVPDLELAGDQTLYAMIDADNQVAELDETNNIVVKALHVVPLPDLAITVADVVLTPALPVPGQPVEARITVRNLGGQDVHNAVVRLLEGDAATGGAVGADQTLAVLAAGASATLTWNWTLGIVPGARTVTVIADPAGSVREGSKDNNIASLPFDVQDSDFFTSERYISPNGDGIQDATAVVFRMPQAGPVEVDVINGAQYPVRHFNAVALNDDLRGQVLWDGRDDQGRVVPDGDYHITATGADHQSHGGVLVTVDNNNSSVLEAVDTPYGVYGDLPQGMYDTQIPPVTSPLRDQLFGFITSTAGTGLGRTDTLFPSAVPVISGSWVEAFRQAQHLQSAGLERFVFSPDGRSLVVSLDGYSGGARTTWILKTGVEQADVPVQLASFSGMGLTQVLGFFDANTIVVGPTADGMLQVIDIASGTVTPLRSFADAQSYWSASVLPFGVLLSGQDNVGNDGLQIFVPRDPGLAVVHFHSMAAADIYHADYTYDAQLSPQATALAVYERDAGNEKIDLIDFASGSRNTLLQAVPGIAHAPQSDQQASVGRYGMGWLERQDQLLVQDAAARTLIAFSETGQRVSETTFPALQRVGDYTWGGSSNVFPAVPDNLLTNECTNWDNDVLGTERQVYDPTINRLFLQFGERNSRFYIGTKLAQSSKTESRYELAFDDGIRDYFSANPDTGAVDTVQQGTLTPLVASADTTQHPLRKRCVDSPPADWPALILGDGARIRSDGHVQTLSRGVLSKRWPDASDELAAIWPDETRVLFDTRAFSSLLNLTAMLQARAQGRGIELSGVATDRNFSYYRLDWAPIEQPNNWQVLTPASSDQVFLDEFLTWVPPQPGTFLIRLTIADKAGNSTSTTASASSFESASIDSFSLSPRYFSPNGDGVNDQLNVKYHVRQPVTLTLRIGDANGNAVRSHDLTYAASELGPHEFDWDGRNDNGQVVSDGRYRINLDGFAAWVTVDTVAPELVGKLVQAYAIYPPCKAADQGCPYPVSVDPQVDYVARDLNLAEVMLESAVIGSDKWSTLSSSQGGSLDSGKDISNPQNWNNQALSMSAFANHSFRLRATDLAGNTHVLALSNAEEQLLLQQIIQPGSDNVSLVRPRTFYYQQPPFSETPVVDSTPPIPPVPVEHDANDRLQAWDASGLLSRIAVEIASADVPDQWTERGNYALADVACPTTTCAETASTGELRLPLDVDALPVGTRAFVRLRGEHADGTRLYSNQGYIHIGGLDPPACDGVVGDGSDKIEVSAKEFYDGALASATLHFIDLSSGAEKMVDASTIGNDQVLFDASANNATAWVTGVDAQGYGHKSSMSVLKCPGSGFVNGPSLWQVMIEPSPVVRDLCDGRPSDQIALGFSIAPALLPPGEALPSHIRLSYVDGISGQRVVLFDQAVDESNATQIGQVFTLSTAQWPEGEYEGRLDMTYPGGGMGQKIVQLPVVKQPPQIQIATPAEGQRVCALPGSQNHQMLPITGSIDSPGDSSYRLEVGAGAQPLGFHCEDTAGEDPPTIHIPGQPPICPSYAQLQKMLGTSVTGALGTINDDLRIYNGITTVRLKGLNWSGGTICTTSTIYLDSDVEFMERKPPATILPSMGGNIVGIAPGGDPIYSQGQFFLRANEPVQFKATLHHATLDPSTGLLQLDDAELATLSQSDSVQGNIDVSWDGRINGAIAADGLYGIAATASDGCTHTNTITYGAVVDSTPPVVALTAPLPGASIAAAVIEIAGSVNDTSLASWSLDVALAASPDSWQNLVIGTSPVPVAAALKAWSRGSIAGPVDLRLSAIDALGNHAETHVAITLESPPKLIGAAELQPPLFSPNADGAIDTTRLQLALLQSASVDIHVNNAANASIATLYSGPTPAGSSGFVWNGADSAGHIVPDGVYQIAIAAQDPNSIAAPESVALSATVDNTPPTLDVQQPTGAFAVAASAVSLHVDDAHLATYRISLTRTTDGVVVASANGTQGGDILLTPLKDFSEGVYALHAVAHDAAGNTTTRDTSFELDATPPSVILSSPADAALIPSLAATSVSGSISDAHLASYTLSVAPENLDSWTDLTHGTANVAPGEILSWHPNLPDGRYRLRLRAIDLAGNITDVVHVIDVDGTPPLAHISAPLADAFVRNSLEIDGSATDAHFANYRISLILASDVTSGQWSDIYSGTSAVDAGRLAALTLNLPEEEYLLRLTVSDAVGLSSTDQVRVRIDTQPPPVPLGLIGHVDNHRDAVLDWNAVTAADLAGYVVYRAGVKLTPTPIAAIHYVDQNAPEARLSYNVRAVDLAGNESASSNTVTLIVDHTPPAVALVHPIANERVRGVYDIIGTAYSRDDFKQYRLSVQQLDPPGMAAISLASSSLPVQGQMLASWSTLGLADETPVRIHLEGEDTQGNIAAVDADVVVDNDPPAAPTGLTAVLVGLDVQTQWNPNSESDLLGYLLYRDNQLVNAIGTTLPADLRPFALTATQCLDQAVPDGQHNYIVYAIDRAGNVSPPSTPASLDPIDNKPPSMTIETPNNGARFDTVIKVFATSRDSDLAEVRFAYRAQGAVDWIDFGPVFTSAPYRTTWIPAPGTPYDTYQIRALARDLGGRYDPAPPVVNVVYADLTPPDALQGLVALADADTVHLAWSASGASDFAGYNVYRDGQFIASAVTVPMFDDTSRPDGDYHYTVTAVDNYGNESDPSNDALTHVFGITLDQPFTPTSAATTDLSGSSLRPGNISEHVDTDLGGSDSAQGATSSTGDIALAAQTLALGGNHFTLRVTDADGNRSRPAEVWMDRGAIPTAPSGVTANVMDHSVNVGWNANGESDVLGYRVFRNGHAVAPDVPLGEPLAAISDNGGDPVSAVDGDPQTAWVAWGIYDVPDESSEYPSLELDWTQSRIITVANLSWVSADYATGDVDIYGWSGHAWIRVAQARGDAHATQSITLDQPYRTTRLKLVPHGSPERSGYGALRLAEVQLFERPVQSAVSLSETLIDGNYHYQVSAVSDFAFESGRSSETIAAVGDTQGPDAVVLNGSLTGNDASLGWTASIAPDVARYDLQRDGNVIASVSAGDALAYVDRNLKLGAHAYVVTAYDGYGNASLPSNTLTLIVTGTGPGLPINLAVVAPISGGALDVNWQSGVGAAPVSYVVRRATSIDGPYAQVAALTATSDHDAALNNGTTYYYTVEAIDAAGNASGPSAPASGTPRDHVAPIPPLLTYPTVARDALTLHSAASNVCGAAEAGAAVELGRDGVMLAPLVASASYVSTPLSFGNTVNYQLAAPDGHHIARVDFDGAVQVVDTDVSGGVLNSDRNTSLQQWAAHGATLYYFDANADDLYRWELGQAPQQITQPVTSVSAFAISAAETTFVVGGVYAVNGGAAVSGVWLEDRAGGTPRRIGTIDPATLSPYFAPTWSPDGTHLLLAGNDATASLVDVATAAVIATLPFDFYVAPAWNSSGTRFAFAIENDFGADDLLVFNLATQTQTTLTQRTSYLSALTWSPGDERLALLDDSTLDIVSAQDGHSLLAQPYVNSGNWYNLTWTASGRVFADIGSDLLRIDPAGWFCTASVALAPGANHVSATATDASGNRGLTSAAVEIDTPTAGLPDLAVAATDIFFLPPSGRVGQSYSALVTLRNTGAAAVAQPTLSVTLAAPDGSQQTLAALAPLSALAAGGSELVTYALGTLNLPGSYRLDVVADPAQQLREANENNNAASTTLTLSGDGKPVLELNLSRSLFAPGDSVSGEVAVTNPGAALTGRVHARVLDGGGATVADLGDLPIAALGFGQRWSAPVSWDAQGVFAGDYSMQAQLFAADGSVLADRTSPFTIAAVRHTQLSLTPDAASQTIGHSVLLHSHVEFSDGNASIAGATLRIAATDTSGAEVWSAQQALGALLPGYVLDRDDTWPTAGLAEGMYTLHLSILSQDYTASTDATVTLAAAVPGIVLGGGLVFDPDTTLIAGVSIALHYRVANQGASALNAVQARLRIVSGANQAPVAEGDDQFDLAPGSTHDSTLTLTAPPLALVNHLAILEARLPGDAPDQWRLLAQQGFAVVDLLPPDISVLSPLADVVQPAVVPFSAAILDRDSAVADAQVSVDGGAWQPVSAGIDGDYARGLAGLGDGTHTLSVRAHDTWGNQAQTASLAFTVDATPPAIVIRGVNDGDMLNHAVAPQLTITDAHLTTSDVRLNGAAFASGSSVDQDGSYVLTARATDAAGNQTLASVRFTIDSVAPTVAITAPIYGAVVNVAAIHVDVQTEAQAGVTLTVGAYQATSVADVQGHAGFDAVPLAVGTNSIAVSATDRAGNVGGPVVVSVTYQRVAVTGSIGPLAAQIARDLALDAPYVVHNAGDTALPGLPLRIELRPAAGGAAVVSDDFSADLPPGTDATGTRELSSTGLTPGDYVAVLLADLPATPGPGGWTALDSAPTHILIDACRSPASDVIFANGFEIPSGNDDRVFCNGFETLLDGVTTTALGTRSWVAGFADSANAFLHWARHWSAVATGAIIAAYSMPGDATARVFHVRRVLRRIASMPSAPRSPPLTASSLRRHARGLDDQVDHQALLLAGTEEFGAALENATADPGQHRQIGVPQ